MANTSQVARPEDPAVAGLTIEKSKGRAKF